MSRKDVCERINKKIEKKEAELKELMEKEKKVSGELETLKNERSSIELEEINISLNANGLVLSDLLEALQNGDLEILQTKLKLNKLKQD